MVIVSLLPHAEFGPNDHRNYAPHFTLTPKLKRERMSADKFLVNAFTCATATTITASFLYDSWFMAQSLSLKPSITLMKTILKHPIELVKTRMQIQGELTRDYKKTYSGTMQSAILIAKEDGFFRLAFNYFFQLVL